jgi:hypothetical protein
MTASSPHAAGPLSSQLDVNFCADRLVQRAARALHSGDANDMLAVAARCYKLATRRKARGYRAFLAHTACSLYRAAGRGDLATDADTLCRLALGLEINASRSFTPSRESLDAPP